MALPVFNLSQDLQNFSDKISKLLPDNQAGLQVTKISIENLTNAAIETLPLKKMVIEINSQCDIFPIIEGTAIYVNRVEKKVRMQCDALVVQNLLPLLTRIGQSQENFITEGESCYWFINNWLDKGYVPKWITYENLENIPPLLDNPQTLIPATQAIGKSGRTEAGFMVKISVVYQRSTDTTILGMHPSELFSLIFWHFDADPCFHSTTENPSIESTETLSALYDHPLLSKLMLFNARGERAYFNDRYWLGLRPPLRTSKRMEWEIRQTHIFHHQNWQREDRTRHPGWNTSLVGIVQNPIINVPANGWRASSKCNIFTGEMCFRSGFRPFNNGNNYMSREGLMNVLTNENQINDFSDESRNLFIGRRLVGKHWFIPVRDNESVRSQINKLIACGSAFIYARRTFCLHKASPPADCTVFASRDADYTSICELKNNATDYHDHREERVLLFSDNTRIVCIFSTHNQRRQVEGEELASIHPVLNKIYISGFDSLTDAEKQQVLKRQPMQHCTGHSIYAEDNMDSDCHKCTEFHVFPFKNITSVTDTEFNSGRFDQHCSTSEGIPLIVRHDVPYAGSLNERQRAIVELIPGGDPLEPWGVRDLTGSNPH